MVKSGGVNKRGGFDIDRIDRRLYARHNQSSRSKETFPSPRPPRTLTTTVPKTFSSRGGGEQKPDQLSSICAIRDSCAQNFSITWAQPWTRWWLSIWASSASTVLI